MRQIATLPDEPARKFTDYLKTIKIDARLIAEAGGIGVWVCDEDRVTQARQELEQFLRSPGEPRYGRAGSLARAMRRQEEAEDQQYNEQQQSAQEHLDEPAEEVGPRPVTFALMAICLVIAIGTQLGGQKDHNAAPTDSWTRNLLISTQPPAGGVGLVEVRAGEVWRLVTPIFLHFGILHLAFNLIMLLPLAGQIESLRGSRWLLFLVAVLAAASNLAQYYLGNTEFVGLQPVIVGSTKFGGMSGVIYGLFGYTWMRSRLDPEGDFQLPTATVVILLAWLFIGPAIQPDIANAAHIGGLVAGILIGIFAGGPRIEEPVASEE